MCVDHRAVDEHARDVADEQDPLGAEADGERRRRLVRVDVERAPRGERRDDRDPARGERVDDGRRRRRDGMPTSPSASTCVAARPIASPQSGTAAGPDRAQTSRVDLGQRLPHDLEHLRRRHPAPVDERGLDAAPLHLGGDLRPGPVHDHDVVALPARARALRGSRSATRPPSLRTTTAHVVYSALMRT